MSETLIVDNLNRQRYDHIMFFNDGGESGVGYQFRLYTSATITAVVAKLRKGGSDPTGTLTAIIYSSDGSFRNIDAAPDTLIASSTNSIDLETDLDTSWSDTSFTFADVVLPAGVYFICFKIVDYVVPDNYLILAVTDQSSPDVGSLVNWSESSQQWYPEGD